MYLKLFEISIHVFESVICFPANRDINYKPIQQTRDTEGRTPISRSVDNVLKKF